MLVEGRQGPARVAAARPDPAPLTPSAARVRLVLLSDTHGLHGRLPPVPEGDVLVHAGDLTAHGTLPGLVAALSWLAALPHRTKLLVAGNHDRCLERDAALAEAPIRDHAPGVTYLRDAAATVDGVRFWGSPWQPAFFDWAFNLPRGEPLARVWARIPDDTEVLITHGPPAGILDQVLLRDGGRRVGCANPLQRVRALRDLRLHVFGHIHEDAGVHEEGGVTFVNASSVTADYRPVNPPIVVDL